MDMNDISDRTGKRTHTARQGASPEGSRRAGVAAGTSGTSKRWRSLLLVAIAGLSVLSLSSCGDDGGGTFYGDRSQLTIEDDIVTLRRLTCGNEGADVVTLETAEVLISEEVDDSGRLDESGTNIIWDDGDHETLLRSSDGTAVTIGETLYTDMDKQDALDDFKPRCTHE